MMMNNVDDEDENDDHDTDSNDDDDYWKVGGETSDEFNCSYCSTSTRTHSHNIES